MFKMSDGHHAKQKPKILRLKLCRGNLKVRAPPVPSGPYPRKRVKGTYHFKEDHPLFQGEWRIFEISEDLLLHICTYLSPYWGAYNRSVIGEIQRRAAIIQASLEDQLAFENREIVRYIKMPQTIKTLRQELKNQGPPRETGFAYQERTFSSPLTFKMGIISGSGRFTGYHFTQPQILLGPCMYTQIDYRPDIIRFKHSRYKITYNTQYQEARREATGLHAQQEQKQEITPSIIISLIGRWASNDINPSPINSSVGKAFIKQAQLERFFEGYLDREPHEELDYIMDRTEVIEYSPNLTTGFIQSAQAAANSVYFRDLLRKTLNNPLDQAGAKAAQEEYGKYLSQRHHQLFPEVPAAKDIERSRTP
jgi:hypothetical protein